MAASASDKFSKVSTGARPTTTTVASIRATSGTSLVCDDLTGWDTDTGVHFVTYKVDGQGDIVAGSQIDMKGTVSSNTISNIVVTGGTDAGNAVGDIVQQVPTARWAKDLADGLLVSHDQDGTLKAGAVDNSAAIADGVVTTAKIADAAVTNAKLSTASGEPGGAWESWTPTLSAITVGNGTLSAKYRMIGKTVNFSIEFTAGTTSSVGNGTYTLPVTAVSGVTNKAIGTASLYDTSGSNTYPAFLVQTSTTTARVIRPRTDTGSNPVSILQSSSDLGAFTWASGDTLSMSGTYEAA